MIARLPAALPTARFTTRALATAVGGALFGLLLAFLVLAIVATQFFGYRVLTIQSYSMEPALTRGDLIVTRPVAIDNLEQGDIIVFEQGIETRLNIAHRVLAVITQHTTVHNETTGETQEYDLLMLRTKGDANEFPDGDLVQAQDLVGEVWFTIPGAGLILHRFPIQFVFLGAVALTALAWGAYEVIARRRAKAALP